MLRRNRHCMLPILTSTIQESKIRFGSRWFKHTLNHLYAHVGYRTRSRVKEDFGLCRLGFDWLTLSHAVAHQHISKCLKVWLNAENNDLRRFRSYCECRSFLSKNWQKESQRNKHTLSAVIVKNGTFDVIYLERNFIIMEQVRLPSQRVAMVTLQCMPSSVNESVTRHCYTLW